MQTRSKKKKQIKIMEKLDFLCFLIIILFKKINYFYGFQMRILIKFVNMVKICKLFVCLKCIQIFLFSFKL